MRCGPAGFRRIGHRNNAGPEFRRVGRDFADQRHNSAAVILVDAGAIHAGIYVQKHSYAAAAPLVDLVFVFGEDGNARLWKLSGDFAYAVRVCADGRIGQENICRAALAGYQQFGVVAHLKLRMPRATSMRKV